MTAAAEGPRVLFSSTLYTPFIEEDEKILLRNFPVEKLIARGTKAVLRLPGAVMRSDVSFSWFGSVYAGYTVLLAKLFRKKSVVVVAGVDASRDREIHYGIWLNPWKSIVVRYAFRRADLVLAVDPFLRREAARLAEYDGKNIRTVAFGFDGRKWRPGRSRESSVLTVAACENEWKLKKKGIDKLFAAAAELPRTKFVVIGIHEHLLPRVRTMAPLNVELIRYVPRDVLLPYYQRAKVYCQPSFTEGLPNALCEAMLCGCIPVGTRAGGIPTAIGDTGRLVSVGDVPALAAAIRSALRLPVARGLKARDRILKHFTLPGREAALVRSIRELAGIDGRRDPGPGGST